MQYAHYRIGQLIDLGFVRDDAERISDVIMKKVHEIAPDSKFQLDTNHEILGDRTMGMKEIELQFHSEDNNTKKFTLFLDNVYQGIHLVFIKHEPGIGNVYGIWDYMLTHNMVTL